MGSILRQAFLNKGYDAFSYIYLLAHGRCFTAPMRFLPHFSHTSVPVEVYPLSSSPILRWIYSSQAVSVQNFPNPVETRRQGKSGGLGQTIRSQNPQYTFSSPTRPDATSRSGGRDVKQKVRARLSQCDGRVTHQFCAQKFSDGASTIHNFSALIGPLFLGGST